MKSATILLGGILLGAVTGCGQPSPPNESSAALSDKPAGWQATSLFGEDLFQLEDTTGAVAAADAELAAAPDDVDRIIAAGRADLCAVARPHLANPAWTLTEAAKIGFTGIDWPRQYLAGKSQMETLFERERAQAAQAADPGAQQQGDRATGA